MVVHPVCRGFARLKGQKVSLKIRMRGTKLWALRGDLLLAEHRLWEGAE